MEVAMEMDLLGILEDTTADWSRKAPASEEAIQALISDTGLDFPAEYLSLLRYSNGGEGELAVQPLWFVIDPVEDVVKRNQEMGIAKWLPGYFRFGSSGGGSSLLFNTRESRPWKVYHVDDVGMEEEYVYESTPDFGAFIKAMGRPSPETAHESEIAPKDVEQWLRQQGLLS
jgi:SMI1 / KNR4 family (SUKH-1)